MREMHSGAADVTPHDGDAGAVTAVDGVYLAALDRALFAENPDLVWELDVDGTVRRANARLADVLGYPPEEVRGRPIGDFETPESGGAAASAFHEAMAGRAGVCECVMRHRDGHAVQLRATVMPLVVDGVVASVFANAQDVTAAREAEQKLREGQTIYHVLVERLPECVAIFTDGRYEFVNSAGAAMRGPGYTPADVEGHVWTQFVDPEDQAAYGGMLAELQAAAEGTSREFDVRMRWPDGRRVEIEGVATAVRLNGRPAVHCFARNITLQRRLDGERMRAQRLEALGRLAAGVAHDVNNLLAVMLIAVESAAAATPDSSSLHEDLADAADAARRGRSLTRQLLTFARRQESRPTTVAINEVVQNMADLLRRIAGPDVQLTVALAADAGAVVADPAQLEQALLNLVTNARDALAHGGLITVETAWAEGDVRLSVRDTGPGIPPDVRPHLFEPFFTTKRDGYGLGLATVYGVITGAGGRVEVESAPAEGTAFHLYFPRAAA
ncbi:MAG TPA: ATP-binding protein [Gemmatirosa sp.]